LNLELKDLDSGFYILNSKIRREKMKWILIGGIIVVVLALGYLSIFALCRASARRDRLEEEAMRTMKKEKEKKKGEEK